MSERARVSSLEALEAFRAKLIIYREKANRVLDEISDEVTRTRLWLQLDRPAHWNAEIRKRNRELEQCQQELFTARVSQFNDPVDLKQAMVRKAREGVRAGEAKLNCVQRWTRAYDQRVETPAKQVEKLRHIVDKDLGTAVHYLDQMVRTLHAYAETSPGGIGRPAPQSEAAAESVAAPKTPEAAS